ncbi:hypothetical protein [Chitinophaga sp. HK235]|uniref:hypothetical protein n=1 Tax=Chitinophaga sp. HK235 TaxID=2952571 RepID=UPI001BA8C16C|nr:hypothetical protein [Chitinophaga sp. HK235]
MRKFNLILKIGLSVLIVLIVAISYAWDKNNWHFQLAGQAANTVPEEVAGASFTEADKQTMLKVFTILRKGMSGQQMSIEGTISIKDPQDSAASGTKPFVFSRDGASYYYALGEIEMLSLKDIYLVCNHASKRIIISPAKKVVTPFAAPGDELIKTFREDKYELTTSAVGEDSLYVLTCNNHVACKQYSYQLNMRTGEVHELFMRLTDITDPLNAAKDKQIRFTMKSWNLQNADVRHFQKNKYLRGEKGHFRPAPAFQQYEIVSSL